MRSEAQKRADKKYQSKIHQYKCNYTLSPEDQRIVDLLNQDIARSGKTVNQWLKDVIFEHLKKRYPLE